MHALVVRILGRLHWRAYGLQGCMWSPLQGQRVVDWMSNSGIELHDSDRAKCSDSLEIVWVVKADEIPDR